MLSKTPVGNSSIFSIPAISVFVLALITRTSVPARIPLILNVRGSPKNVTVEPPGLKVDAFVVPDLVTVTVPPVVLFIS